MKNDKSKCDHPSAEQSVREYVAMEDDTDVVEAALVTTITTPFGEQQIWLTKTADDNEYWVAYGGGLPTNYFRAAPQNVRDEAPGQEEFSSPDTVTSFHVGLSMRLFAQADEKAMPLSSV